MSSENREISPLGFRQGSSPFEEKTGMASGESIEKYIERPGDPEILFYVLFRRAESSCRAEEHVTAVPRCCSEKLRETGIHHDRRLVERFSGPGIAFLVGLEKPLGAVAFE